MSNRAPVSRGTDRAVRAATKLASGARPAERARQPYLAAIMPRGVRPAERGLAGQRDHAAQSRPSDCHDLRVHGVRAWQRVRRGPGVHHTTWHCVSLFHNRQSARWHIALVPARGEVPSRAGETLLDRGERRADGCTKRVPRARALDPAIRPLFRLFAHVLHTLRVTSLSSKATLEQQ